MLARISCRFAVTCLDVDVAIGDCESAAKYNTSDTVKAITRPEDATSNLSVSRMFVRAFRISFPVQSHLYADRSRISNLRPSSSTIWRSLTMNSEQNEELDSGKIVLI
jgi:hypothetical protein